MIAMTAAERAAARLYTLDKPTLAAGPWCWPADAAAILAQAPDFKCADDFGVAPFLTVADEGVVSLLLVALEGRRVSSLRAVAIQPDSLAAVVHASSYLELLVPRAPSRLRPSALFLDDVVLADRGVPHGGAPRSAQVVEGGSFGLAALLALTSRALLTPHPPDVIAIATVDDCGAVGPVDEQGLRDKVMALRRLAPRIRRVIVAEGQHAAAGVAGHEVIAVSTVARALEQAWSVAAVWELAARLPVKEATKLADEVIGAALFGKAPVNHHYEGLAAVAGCLLSREDLPSVKRTKLAIARAVAQRHTNNGGAFSLPAELRLPEREELIAHWLQQCADVGGEPAAVDAIASELSPNSAAASHGLAKAHGAVARWWAVTGAEHAALRLALKTARYFVEALEPKDATHTLCLALQLAGVLSERTLFDEAATLWTQVRDEVDDASAAFVRLAHARGALLIDPTAMPLHQSVLEELWYRPEPYRWHVSTAAGRLLARSSDEEREAVRAELTSWTHEPEGMKSWIAQVTLELIGLDEALSMGSAVEAEASVVRLSELDPGVLRNLRAGLLSGRSFPEWVARAYPY
jgi:hypothetical protein